MIRLLAGLFSAAALAAVAGVAGLAMVVWMYDRDLPDTRSLAEYEPATLSRVYSGEGRLLAEFLRERRVFTPIEEIPPLVREAFISAEDKNFYVHPGVDALGILRALVANVNAIRSGEGGRMQGASTITQQVMKNFLVGDDYSIERKIKEAILSVRIEQTLSKDRILELYLNEIFLGQNAYGVAAAAQRYFGKTLEDLTIGEAAYLAALPKAPSSLHPIRHLERARGRRNYVLREMRENGQIDEAAMRAAQQEPLRTVIDGSVEPEVQSPAPRDYFADEVRRRLVAELGEDALETGGLSIRATVDPEMQRVGAAALRAQLEKWDRERGGYGGAVATVEPAALAGDDAWRGALAEVDAPRDVPGWRPAVVLSLTGEGAVAGVEGEAEIGLISFPDARGWARPRLDEGRRGPAPGAPQDVWSVGDVVLVSAMEGTDGAGRPLWSLRQIPEIEGAFMAMDVSTGRVLALQGGFSYDHSAFNRATQAQRQPGSAFKPFVYAAALDAGYSPDTIILDAPIVVMSGGERWTPKNSGGDFLGPAPMRVGLERSRNAMTIRLAQEIGIERVAAYAERFGVYESMPALLSYTLGAGETTVDRMLAAYALFANGGREVTPRFVDRVQDRRGNTILSHGAEACVGCDRPPSAGDAPRLRDAGRRILDPHTANQIRDMLRGVVTRGTAARAFAGVDAPVAGKTGTTNDARDVWFVGFSPNIVAGCFIGHDEPRPIGRGAFGGTLCAPVVAEFFAEIGAVGAGESYEALGDDEIAAFERDAARAAAARDGLGATARLQTANLAPELGGEGMRGLSFGREIALGDPALAEDDEAVFAAPRRREVERSEPQAPEAAPNPTAEAAPARPAPASRRSRGLY